jgi:hypothetical protein
MKKTILLFAVALGLLTACNPIKEEGSFDVTNISADQLLANSTFSQYADIDCTIPAADGNYIKFNCPNVQSLTIFYLKPDGSEQVLSTGKAGGVFNFTPKRGSDPVQTVYFRYVNQDGKDVVASKEFTLQVAADLAPEIKYLASNAGKKKWMWDLSMNGQCWGNAAYCMGDGADFAENGANQWWGTTPDMLWFDGEEGQYGHTDKDDSKAGEGDFNAYMIITEDGDIATYDAAGKALRTGKYEVKGYDGKRHDVGGNAWDLGHLVTDKPVVMFPYMINGGGTTVTEFEILGLNDDQLVLVYPGTAAPGSWSEATVWRFVAVENEDLLYKDWTWELKKYDGEAKYWKMPEDPKDPEAGSQSWGNFAYAMGSGEGFANKSENQWWGCPPEMLWYNGEHGQYGHTDKDDSKAGEGDSGAYMTIEEGGKITTYDKDGKALRSANYEFELFDTRAEVGGNPWNIGTLKTSAPAVMFPYMINGGGTTVTEFEVMGLTGTSLVLVYPGTAAPGSWSEATFWRFTKKK